MANPQFFEPNFIFDFVPDENIGKKLERLYIKQSNIKYLDDKIADAKRHPDVVPREPQRAACAQAHRPRADHVLGKEIVKLFRDLGIRQLLQPKEFLRSVV